MPPPVQIGEREEPARARPVPFWRHGLAPPPDTWPRVFVDAVPCRRAFSSARTVSCTSGMLKLASNAVASSVTEPPPIFGALAIGPDLHDPALRPGRRSANEQQILLRQHLDDGQPPLGDAPAAHAAGSADALEHARGRRRRADRTRRADVVRAVRLRAAGEVVALDRPLEALAL